MEFEYLEHTADAKFKAYGDSLEKAFVNAGKATFGLLLDCDKVKPVIEKKIEVKGKKIGPLESHARNPAFDVTPAKFITGIITEKGIFKPEELIKLKENV